MSIPQKLAFPLYTIICNNNITNNLLTIGTNETQRCAVNDAIHRSINKLKVGIYACFYFIAAMRHF